MGVRRGYSQSKLWWAFLIKKTDGTEFIAWAEHGTSMPGGGQIFKTRRQARSQQKCVGLDCRIVRLRLSIQEVR